MGEDGKSRLYFLQAKDRLTHSNHLHIYLYILLLLPWALIFVQYNSNSSLISSYMQLTN